MLMVSAYDFTTVFFNHYLSLTSIILIFLQYITATLMFGLQFLFFLKFNRYSSQVVTFQKKEERIFQQPALRCFQDLIVKGHSQLIRSKQSSRSHHGCASEASRHKLFVLAEGNKKVTEF